MLIIGVEMTLKFEILYPAMTTLLILTETRSFGTLTRFVMAVIGASVGFACAIALMALFIQQPFFLLPIMWAFIIVVMYYMGASRYRGMFFACGYTFIVIVYMSFFDKTHAEHVAMIVYKSVLTGLACGSVVMMFVWPERPEATLRERLERGFRRSRETIAALITAADGRGSFDRSNFVPEAYRMRAPALVQLLDQAQTDLDFGEDKRSELLALIALDSRAAASIAVAVDDGATQPEHGASGGAEALRSLDAELAAAIGSLEDGVFATLAARPDFGTLFVRNLRDCLPRIFRKPLWSPDVLQLQHAVKCATAIMICALFCIAINWSLGIGCVETVMLVVQATLGGTLLIGGLRLLGVISGYAISIIVVVFLMPTINELPGLLVVMGLLLAAVGYAMHGSPRVCVPAMQTMIVIDFALLQLVRPDDSLDPAMDFSLAVAMGVVVTFAVYRLLWPVSAARNLGPAVASMRRHVEEFVQRVRGAPISARDLNAAHLQMSDDYAVCVTAHANAQLEDPQSPIDCDRQLAEITDAARECEAALALASRARHGAAPRPGE